MLEEFLGSLKTEVQETARVAVFARVEAFYATGPDAPCVDARPTSRDIVRGLDYDREFIDIPVAPKVPVMYPQASGVSITFRLNPGDTVLLLIPARSWHEWYSTGQVPSDEPDERTHSLGNAVAFPVGFTRGHGAPIPAEGVALSGAVIHLGSSDASRALALAQETATVLAKIVAAFNTHIHPSGSGPTSPPQAVPSVIPLDPVTLADVASTVVKTSG